MKFTASAAAVESPGARLDEELDEEFDDELARVSTVSPGPAGACNAA